MMFTYIIINRSTDMIPAAAMTINMIISRFIAVCVWVLAFSQLPAHPVLDVGLVLLNPDRLLQSWTELPRICIPILITIATTMNATTTVIIECPPASIGIIGVIYKHI